MTKRYVSSKKHSASGMVQSDYMKSNELVFESRDDSTTHNARGCLSEVVIFL